MTEEIIIDGVDVSGCVKQGETVAGITCGNGERIRFEFVLYCKTSAQGIYSKS